MISYKLKLDVGIRVLVWKEGREKKNNRMWRITG